MSDLSKYQSLMETIHKTMPAQIFVTFDINDGDTLTCNLPLLPDFQSKMKIRSPKDLYGIMVYANEKAEAIRNHPKLNCKYVSDSRKLEVHYGRFVAQLEVVYGKVQLSVRINGFEIFQEIIKNPEISSYYEESYEKYVLRAMDTLISEKWCLDGDSLVSDKADQFIVLVPSNGVICLRRFELTLHREKATKRFWHAFETEKTFHALALGY